MKKTISYLIIIVIIIGGFLSICLSQLQARTLTGVLLKPRGDVQYFDGKKWRTIKNDKFLFNKYAVKTGVDGSCKIISLKNGTYNAIDNESEVVIKDSNICVVKGNVGKLKPVGIMLAGLSRKYASALEDHYQTRSVSFDVTKNIILSKNYSDLVWDNLGEDYNYQLNINNKVYNIPSSKGKIIRYTVKGLKPGRFQYSVDVLKDGQIFQSSPRDNYITWFSRSDMNDLNKDINPIRHLQNDFLMASAYEEIGLKVAAMDFYHAYFKNKEHDDEMKQVLVNVYKELNLNNLLKELQQSSTKSSRWFDYLNPFSILKKLPFLN